MNIFKKIIAYFLKGILIAGPIFLTIYIAIFLFNWLDELIPFKSYLPDYIKNFPGFGVFFIFFFFVCIGLLTNYIAFANIFKKIGAQFLKIPLINFLFSSIKDIFSAFDQENSKFNKPVLIQLTDTEVFQIGFMVREELGKLDLVDYVCVYLPYSFGFTGKVIIVHKDKIKKRLPNTISSSEILKFIISGGIAYDKK